MFTIVEEPVLIKFVVAEDGTKYQVGELMGILCEIGTGSLRDYEIAHGGFEDIAFLVQVGALVTVTGERQSSWYSAGPQFNAVYQALHDSYK